MASTSASAAVTDDDLAVAEQQFEDGVELLEADDFVSASDCFAQCLELKVTKFGEHDPAVAPVYLKYAASLLGCARQQGDNLLGSLKTKTQNDGASTSSGAGKEPAGDDDSSDLSLAWQMAELARLVFTSNKDKFEDINAKLAEVHEVLADISAEREAFEDAINDFEEAFKFLDACAEVDVRWQAEVHFKISIPLELSDRVDDAMTHINTAIAQLKYLLKQKMATRDELARAEAEAQPEASPAGAPAGDTPAASALPAAEPAEPAAGSASEPADTAPESAPTAAAEENAAERADEAAADAAAAATADAGDGDAAGGEGGEEVGEEAEEETELEAVIREIGELEGVLKDLEERRQELVTAKEQDKAVKQQLKTILGSSALGEFSAPAGAKPAGGPVQDLGVKGGKRTKENVDAGAQANAEGKEAKSGGGSNAGSSSAATKRTLEDVMGGGDVNGKSAKKAAL